MSIAIKLSVTALALAMAGCAGTQTGGSAAPTSGATAPAAAAATAPVAKPAAGSKFAKLTTGMQFGDVTALIGTPNDMYSHESGKRWIPFYFGGDIRKTQALYKDEGCLTFSGGNQFGGGSGQLLEITADKSGKCFK